MTHSCEATEWEMLENTYCIRVSLCFDGDGYSAHAANLPGVVSQGSTIEEAIENIREAATGAIEQYHEDMQGIPWGEVEIDDFVVHERSILVKV